MSGGHGRVRRTTARLRDSVRARVAVAAALVFAVALGVGSMLLLRTLEDRLVDDLRTSAEQSLQRQAASVMQSGVVVPPAASAVRVGDDTVGFQVLIPGSNPIVATVDEQAAAGGRTAGPVLVTHQDGTVSAAIPPPGQGAVFLDALTTVGAGVGASSGEFTTPIDPDSARLLGVSMAEPVIVTTLRVNDDVSLATASSLAEVTDTIATTRQVLWWAVPAMVALVGALAWAIAGRALRPVHAITSQVAAINRESLHERVPAPASHDEVAELATTMNSMLDRLERSSDSNRRLVSDAAHELRTPIAVIRAELEVARRHDAEATTDEWDAVADRVLRETDRLQQLVDDLLLLSRLDERRHTSESLAVDDLVRDVAGRRRRVGIEIVELPPTVDIQVDADAARRALDHVVANAARHAESSVSIAVGVTSGPSPTVTIDVDDDGPGIPVDERERVTERFVRLDEGRSRDAGGSGLGLAVVADVMAAHGGQLIIGDSLSGGARVSLVFPLEVAALAPAPV